MTASLTIAIAGGVGTLAGALLTASASAVTAAVSRRHEHRRWLLDKRLESYSAMNTALATWLRAYAHVDRDGLPALTEAIGDLADKQQAVRLLATPATRQRAHDVLAVALAAYMGAATAAQEGRDLSDEESDAAIDQLATEGQALFEAQVADIEQRPHPPAGN